MKTRGTATAALGGSRRLSAAPDDAAAAAASNSAALAAAAEIAEHKARQELKDKEFAELLSAIERESAKRNHSVEVIKKKCFFSNYIISKLHFPLLIDISGHEGRSAFQQYGEFFQFAEDG